MIITSTESFYTAFWSFRLYMHMSYHSVQMDIVWLVFFPVGKLIKFPLQETTFARQCLVRKSSDTHESENSLRYARRRALVRFVT